MNDILKEMQPLFDEVEAMRIQREKEKEKERKTKNEHFEIIDHIDFEKPMRDKLKQLRSDNNGE
jgi:hypothetical protein